jgi:hypothetical protein
MDADRAQCAAAQDATKAAHPPPSMISTTLSAIMPPFRIVAQNYSLRF